MAVTDYIFRFDRPLPPVVFGGEVALSGWLFEREGRPIHGLRAVLRRRFFREKIFRGRRKRERPDAAAAYPEMEAAGTSGFLLELQLPLGRSHLSFQVLDHERHWQTFAQTSVTAFPFSLFQRFGLVRTRSLLISHLQRRFASGAAQIQPGGVLPRSIPAPQPLRIDLFATSKSNLFMVEIGELIAAGFRELGGDAQLQLDGVPQENPPNDTLQMIVAPHEYHPLFLTQKFPPARVLALTQKTHLLCTEQPETGWFEGSLQWARHSLGVADIHPLGVGAYRAQGLPAKQLALGFHPLLAHAPLPPHNERSTDITFLGSMTPRREEFLARHADFLAAHRCHLRLVPLQFAKTEATRSYLTAGRRNELLSQSRILLNLHHGEQRYFEWHRLLVGLANGCCIISETCVGHGPLVPGKHFIMVEPEQLMVACEYYLAHPDECARIAAAGRQFIETELRQAQACAAFLEHVERGTSNPPVADALAEPLPAALRRQMARQARRLFFRAFREDLTEHQSPVPVPPADIVEPDEKQRAELAVKRAAYRARLQQQEETRAHGEPIFQLHENEACARGGPPSVSVLITLYNYAQHIEECVASARVSLEQLVPPGEIVIVDDASTDDSLENALRCLRASPLPLRVVQKKFNTGLADARNTGLELARAPYVFMMDADNLVFPEALPQLFAAISQAQADAAYSLLCRFRGTPKNRVGLLSPFDWDPQILVQYPYIDAMAMFRRETLRELGGYDNDLNQIGWFGWEDYDLWLRFAQRNRRVAFVPNTLCLYRLHETSMIQTTNLFALDLVQHLLGRYGELLERFEPRATVFNVARERIAQLRAASLNSSHGE